MKQNKQVSEQARPLQLPHDVLCELIGQFQMSVNDENDVYLAEQLASNSYDDVDSALSAIRSQIVNPGLVKKFMKTKAEILKEPFFSPYLKQA